MRTPLSGRLTVMAVVLVGFSLCQLPSARAGILSRLRASISSLWGRKSYIHESAESARARAGSYQGRATALHDRLEMTQQAAAQATDVYYNYWRQMRRTEAQIVTTRHRIQIVTARYNHRRHQFGRRLSAIERTGKLGYMQLFLGSRSLSDLTRRAYLFNALTQRDAELQAGLRADRDELQRSQVMLMAQWNERNRLQLAANHERVRIVSAEVEQQRMLHAINHSRYATLAYVAAQEQSSREINEMIDRLSARRASIAESYESSRRSYRYGGYGRGGYRHYVRRRVAHRVQRVRYVRGAGGGILKPMAITDIVYHDEMVPAGGGGGSLSEGFTIEGDHHDGGWGMPVRGHLSSRYGVRYHPILHRRKLHTGDDLAAPYGAPIRAAHGGRVLWSGWKKAYGNTVIVDNGDGTSALYGHASKVGVKTGQPVKRGEYIGNVGSTGWSTGPHLHFEVRKNGQPVDPTPYLHGKH